MQLGDLYGIGFRHEDERAIHQEKERQRQQEVPRERGEFWLAFAFAFAAVANLLVTFEAFFLIVWQSRWPVTEVFNSESFRISFGGRGIKFFAENGQVVAFFVRFISTVRWLAFLFPTRLTAGTIAARSVGMP